MITTSGQNTKISIFNGIGAKVEESNDTDKNNQNQRQKGKQMQYFLWMLFLYASVIVALPATTKFSSVYTQTLQPSSQSSSSNNSRDINVISNSNNNNNARINFINKSDSDSDSDSNTNRSSGFCGGLIINNDDSVENTKKKKKFFALHIGPAKTGTTAIQKSSAYDDGLRKALALDGVNYFGKYTSEKSETSPMQGIAECMIQTYRTYWRKYNNSATTTANNSTVLLLRERFINNCWGRNNEHYTQKSIIDSSEGYSNFMSSQVVPQINVLRTIMMDYFDYDEFLLIGAYRPYAQMLSSAYKEATEQSCLFKDDMNHGTCENIWKITKYQMKNYPYGGMIGRRAVYHNIHKTLKQDNPGIDVKVLHRYFRHHANKSDNKYDSITTEMYCDALGDTRTPNTCCFLSQDRASSAGDNTVFNKGHSYDAVWFDDILIAGAQKGGVPVNLNRRQARKRLMQYYEKELELEAAVKETSKDGDNHLPLLCPPQNELELLLKKSLEFERLVKSKFSLPPLRNTNNEEEEAEHVRKYWKMVEQDKAFCWVDTDKLFPSPSQNTTISSTNSTSSFWQTVFGKAFS